RGEEREQREQRAGGEREREPPRARAREVGVAECEQRRAGEDVAGVGLRGGALGDDDRRERDEGRRRERAGAAQPARRERRGERAGGAGGGRRAGSEQAAGPARSAAFDAPAIATAARSSARKPGGLVWSHAS